MASSELNLYEPDQVNRNQGAESTLAFLVALVLMRLAESALDVPAREMLVPTVT